MFLNLREFGFFSIVKLYIIFLAVVKLTTEVNDTDGAALQNTTVICNFGNMDGWKFLIIQNTPYKGKPYLVMNLTSDERIMIPREIKERLYLNLDVNSASGTIRVSFLLQCGDLGRYECKVHNGDYSYLGGGELKCKIYENFNEYVSKL